MKKVFALLLVLAMVMGMATTAFAAESDAEHPKGNLTMAGDAAANRTYEGFMLMTATNSGDKYAYVVNEKYQAVLIAALNELVYTEGEKIGQLVIGTALPANADSDAIVAAVDTLDATGIPAEQMTHFADSLYRKILAAGLEKDITWTGTAKQNVTQAYWLIADVTDLAGTNLNNSLVMIDTVGVSDVTVNVKPDPISDGKKLDDENDSLVYPDTESEDEVVYNQDVADYDIGDQVPFRLFAQLPGNAAEYKYYSIIMKDTVSEGLTFVPETFSITVNTVSKTIGPLTEGAATDFVYVIDGQTLYVFPNHAYVNNADEEKQPSSTNGGDLLPVIGENATHDQINKATVTFTYKCTLNEKAAFKNFNDYSLIYSNNPFGDSFGQTPVNTNIVLTYKFVVNKVDEQKKPLTGADFSLFKFIAKEPYTEGSEAPEGLVLNSYANAYGVWEEVTRKTTNAEGDGTATTFTFNGLDDGYYKIEETTVPAGYNAIDPIEFKIFAKHVTEAADHDSVVFDVTHQLLGDTVTPGVADPTVDDATGIFTMEIENKSGLELPSTGGMGTTVLYITGGLLVVFALVMLITKKRMSVEG